MTVLQQSAAPQSVEAQSYHKEHLRPVIKVPYLYKKDLYTSPKRTSHWLVVQTVIGINRHLR